MAYGIVDLSKNLLGIKPNSTGLRKDEFWAVDNISFELRRGEVLGLIGGNGSGKTTLLRLLAGIFPPDKGEISIKGRVGALIAVGAGFHPYMTGRENIYLNGTILGMNREEINSKFQDIVDFAEIGDFLDAPVSTYSSGMRVRLGFSIAAQLEPDILLIDEVLAVGDQGFRVKCINRIKELIKNSAVIFVTHTMQQVSNICSKVIVLDKGGVAHQTHDIPAGIDYYFSRFKLVEQNISGSNKAVLSNIVISNGRESARESQVLPLNHGGSLTIEFTLMLHSPVNDVAIIIWLETQDMRPVADCFSKFCGHHIQPKKKSRILLTLSSIPLNMGIYTINIAVMDYVTKEALCRYANCARLQANTLYTSWASFALEGVWNQTPA